MMNGVAKNTFTIDANNNITAFASLMKREPPRSTTPNLSAPPSSRKKLEGDPANPEYLLTGSHVGYRFAETGKKQPASGRNRALSPRR